MINSHYVPRFILKKFTLDDKHLIYGDIENKKCSFRNLESIFSEKGYYSDEVENELCVSVERQFANLLNNKILKSSEKIEFNREELFLLKKYLMISMSRIRYLEGEVDTKNGEIIDQIVYDNSNKYFETSIKQILECKNSNECFDLLNKLQDIEDKNPFDVAFEKNPYRTMKLIVPAYMSFVTTENCGRDFVISDVTCGCWFGRDPLSKLTYLLNNQDNPCLRSFAHLLDPADYVFFPLTKKLGVLAISPVYKKENLLFDATKFSRSNIEEKFGFDDKKILRSPEVTYSNMYDMNTGKYVYTKTQLTAKNAIYFNSLIMQIAKKFIAYSDLDKIKDSLEYYISWPYAKNELSFIKEFEQKKAVMKKE